MSWTGSEDQRREQGICRSAIPDETSAPKWERSNPPAKYLVPAGTELSIARVDDPSRKWARYVTRVDLGFRRYETLNSGAYTFREQGYLLLVRKEKLATIASR